MIENIGAYGAVEIIVRRRGKVIQIIRQPNIITNTGLTQIARTMSGSGTAVSHMATGSGSTTPKRTDTALSSEAYRDAVTNTDIIGTGKVRFKLFIGSGSANGTVIRECGLFNAASGGDMYARTVFSSGEVVTKTSDITIQINWTLTYT